MNQCAYATVIELLEIGYNAHQRVLLLFSGFDPHLVVLTLLVVVVLSVIAPLSLMLYCGFSEIEAELKLARYIQVSLNGKRE